MENNLLVPVISLWMPWANWIMLGWKKIETRTHTRFKSLVGKRIGIHATMKWDNYALLAASPWLTPQQIEHTNRFLKIGGAILGTVYVSEFRLLTANDSQASLINCDDVLRYGLVLEDVQICEAKSIPGKQGIWYAQI